MGALVAVLLLLLARLRGAGAGCSSDTDVTDGSYCNENNVEVPCDAGVYCHHNVQVARPRSRPTGASPPHARRGRAASPTAARA